MKFASSISLICLLCVLCLFGSGCAYLTGTPDSALDSPESAETAFQSATLPEKVEAGYSEENVNSEEDMLSTRILMEEARSLACTGATQYVDGDMENARGNLEAALLNLQLLDLPEDMLNIGFFQPYLPDRCNAVDLNKAYNELMDDEPSGALTDTVSIPEIPAGEFAAGDAAFIEKEILRIMKNLGEESIRPDELEIFVKEVERFVAYFSTTKKDWFERSYYRMMKYVDTVSAIMVEKRMPIELTYLAFIESGYMYRANSRANARGIWQFIRGTGRQYGLKIGRRIDERLDPVKATIAAREYLLDLISIFGSSSFLLAMASYNAGEGKVQRCLRQVDDPFEDRSFWQIRECLRRETREYIPRIIAAAILCDNPGKFGLKLQSKEEIFTERDLVICPRQVKLSSVAKAAGISLKQLRELNPDLPSGRYWTPVNNTHLWIPDGKEKTVNVALASMASAPEPAPGDDYYVVRRGDSLYRIGNRYKIPFKRLASWNKIRKPYKIKPGQKIYLSPPGQVFVGGSKAATGVTQCTDSLVYIVKKGNYLAGIGSLFGVRARDIMNLNKLKRGRIFPGQRLAVCPSFPVEIINHKVVKNETMSRIAKKHKIKTEDLRFINGLRKNQILYVGQILTIYRRSS